MKEHEILEKIREFFEHNFERMKLEGGRTITEDAKQLALNQVLFYYQKLKDVANKVTSTEVKLTLPEQRSEKGRKFTIEGVVDIVKEGEGTWMYDIKTHDPEYIKSDLSRYEDQLNVYAHIWQGLRGEDLDETAVISTAYPQSLKLAIIAGDLFRIQHEVAKWEPIIPIKLDQGNVQETIKEFSKTVDAIEENEFYPASIDTLKSKMEGTHSLFATRICRNCDARFSCPSYRDYATSIGKGERGNFKKYFDDFGTDADKEEWINANLSAKSPDEIDHES